MFPVKYRWPVFALDATPLGDCRAIIDEEGKIRARAPKVSKCRHMPLDFSDDDRRERNGLFEVLPPRVPFPHLETQGSSSNQASALVGFFECQREHPFGFTEADLPPEQTSPLKT